MDTNTIIWIIVGLSVGSLVIKMTRNAALYLLAWFAVMFAINATLLGQVIENEVRSLPGGIKLTADELTILSFIIASAFTIILGKVFVALWGTHEQAQAS